MTKLKLTSTALIVAAMLAAPVMAREGHANSRHATTDTLDGPFLDGMVCHPFRASRLLRHSRGLTSTCLASPRSTFDASASQRDPAGSYYQATKLDRHPTVNAR